MSWRRLKLSPSAALEQYDQGKSRRTFLFIDLFYWFIITGLFMEVSGSLWSYWTWENISHSQAVFYFWKSKAHIYFTEHLSYAGQILLFFSFLLWARYKSNTKQHLPFFLYHTLAMCLPLIIFHPPVRKLNASGTKIGIQCEVGVLWSSRVPSMSGSVFVRLSLLGSFNHQTCHYTVILQSTFFSDCLIWVSVGFSTALRVPQHICWVHPLLRVFTARERWRVEDVKCWNRKGKKSI